MESNWATIKSISRKLFGLKMTFDYSKVEFVVYKGTNALYYVVSSDNEHISIRSLHSKNPPTLSVPINDVFPYWLQIGSIIQSPHTGVIYEVVDIHFNKLVPNVELSRVDLSIDDTTTEKLSCEYLADWTFLE